MNITGKAIRRARYRNGWSQSKLAEKLKSAGLDLDRSAISKIEPGIRKINDVELLGILYVLGASFEEIIPYRDIIIKTRFD